MKRNAFISQSLKILRQQLDLQGDILDVGVQEATPTLQAAFPASRHILFEPVAEYHAEIRKRYRDYSYLLFGEAVSDVDGTTFLMPVRQTRGEDVSHSYIIEDEQVGSRPIRSTTIDSVVDRANLSPSMLKIDVEGADIPTRILKGARKTVKSIPVIMIEMTMPKFAERHAEVCETHQLWDLCDLSYYGNVLWQFDAIYLRHDLLARTPALSPMTDDRPFNPEIWQAGFEPGMQ